MMGIGKPHLLLLSFTSTILPLIISETVAVLKLIPIAAPSTKCREICFDTTICIFQASYMCISMCSHCKPCSFAKLCILVVLLAM